MLRAAGCSFPRIGEIGGVDVSDKKNLTDTVAANGEDLGRDDLAPPVSVAALSIDKDFRHFGLSLLRLARRRRQSCAPVSRTSRDIKVLVLRRYGYHSGSAASSTRSDNTVLGRQNFNIPLGPSKRCPRPDCFHPLIGAVI